MSGHTPSEPVAWRCRHPESNGQWALKHSKPNSAYADWEVQPLYSQAANEAKIEALESILRRILKYGELGNVGTGGWNGNKPTGNPMSKDVWQFPRHMLTDIEAALAANGGDRG